MGIANKFNKYKLSFHSWLLEECSSRLPMDVKRVFNLQKSVLKDILAIDKSMEKHINIEVSLYSYNRRELLSWIGDNGEFTDDELRKRRELTSFLRKWERHKGDYNGFATFVEFSQLIEHVELAELATTRYVLSDMQTIIDGLKLTIK